MDKLQMAQDYIIAEVRRVGICSIDEDKIMDAWKVADAMQAEADERKPSGLPDALKEEWQPDWSQAPETAIAWKMQSKSNAVWIHNKRLSAFDYSIAPTFNYQGDWKDSLRKRPQ